MGNPKISDCETVLKKQAAAIRAAVATLNSAVKVELREINGKKHKVAVADPAVVKQADAQYRAACVAAGHQYELMKEWFEKGKNAAVNDFEKAGAEWAKAKKTLEAAVDSDDFGMAKLLKDSNKK